MLFQVLIDGWVAGERRTQGELLELTEAEAKYEAVTPHRETLAPKPKTAKRRPKP